MRQLRCIEARVSPAEDVPAPIECSAWTTGYLEVVPHIRGFQAGCSARPETNQSKDHGVPSSANYRLRFAGK